LVNDAFVGSEACSKAVF